MLRQRRWCDREAVQGGGGAQRAAPGLSFRLACSPHALSGLPWDAAAISESAALPRHCARGSATASSRRLPAHRPADTCGCSPRCLLRGKANKPILLPHIIRDELYAVCEECNSPQ